MIMGLSGVNNRTVSKPVNYAKMKKEAQDKLAIAQEQVKSAKKTGVVAEIALDVCKVAVGAGIVAGAVGAGIVAGAIIASPILISALLLSGCGSSPVNGETKKPPKDNTPTSIPEVKKEIETRTQTLNGYIDQL
jgi:hypothetical protein